MSLMCSSTAAGAQYFAVMSSKRNRVRNKMVAGGASGATRTHEHWVALNKNTFLDILNDILAQSVVPTPNMTSRAPGDTRWPTDADVNNRMSSTRSILHTSTSDADRSRLFCYGRNMTSSAECRQSADGERVNVSQRKCVDGTARSVTGSFSAFTRNSDVRAMEKKQNVQARHVDEVCDNVEQQSLLSSKCLYIAPPTNFSGCRSAASDKQGCSDRVGSQALWMPIDKTLLCDVVDQMLYHDKTFGFRDLHGSTFPFQLNDYMTRRFRSDSRSRNQEISTASTRQRSCVGSDFIPCSIFSSNCHEREPEMPRRSLMMSSVHNDCGFTAVACPGLTRLPCADVRQTDGQDKNFCIDALRVCVSAHNSGTGRAIVSKFSE